MCLKNNREFSLFGQFSVPLSFLNQPIIISLLTQLLVKLALQIYKNGRHELLNEVEETARVNTVNSQLGPVAPVYSELLHFSDWEGDPWYRFYKQNNNSARAWHVFVNFYSPSLRYVEDISTQRQVSFFLFTLWWQCSLKLYFHGKINYIWPT